MSLASRVAALLQRQPGALGAPARGTASRGGGAFLPDLFGGEARQWVEMAFGADLTADPDTWTWTDVTSYFLWEPGVSTTIGRPPESTRITPATMTGVIRNDQANGGDWTVGNALSPRWPDVRENTPVRDRLDVGSGPTVRFQGYAVSFKPDVLAIGDDGERISVVQFKAAGRARQVLQGKSAAQSPLRRALTLAEPFAYYPLEDGPAADEAGTVIGSASTLVRLHGLDAPEFGAVRPPTGASTMPSFIRGGEVQLSIGSLVASAWTAEFSYFFGTGEPADDDYSTPDAMNVLKIFAVNGDYWEIQFAPHNATYANGRVALFRSDVDDIFFDTLEDTALGTYDPWDGRTHHVTLTASQSGGNIAWQLLFDGVTRSSGTLVGRTLQAASYARLNANSFLASSSTYGMGHFAFFESVLPTATIVAHALAAQSNSGESVSTRLRRIAAEAGIELDIVGTADIAMGAQGDGGDLDLMSECEAVDGGVLLDGLGPGFTYICRTGAYGRAADLTLDVSAGQVLKPLRVEHDDLGRVNTFTASNPLGGQRTFTKETGDLSTGEVGVYDSSGGFSVALDATLYDIAAWRVNLGTVPGLRYPGVSFELAKDGTTPVAQQWLDTRPLGRVDVLGIIPGAIDPDGEFLLRSWTERWNSRQWSVTVALSPYTPWSIATVADTLGDDSEFLFRPSAGYSTLAAGVAAGASSFSVITSTGPVWTTVADDIDGLIIEIDGLRIPVTSITGATSPQTFTVDGTAVRKALSAGADVDVWQPPPLGL